MEVNIPGDFSTHNPHGLLHQSGVSETSLIREAENFCVIINLTLPPKDIEYMIFLRHRSHFI